MIGVQVTETDKVEVFELRAGLAEAQEGAAAGIDQHARLAVDPEQVTGRRPAVVGDRTAGAEHLQPDPVVFGTARCERMSSRRNRQYGNRVEYDPDQSFHWSSPPVPPRF